MSLLDFAYEDCVIYDKQTKPDGEGGVITVWQEGANVKAAITLDTSMEARIGEQQGAKNVYTITTPKSVLFRFHDVIKRLKDNKVFRITSDGDDKLTPASSTLNMRQVTAEEWDLK